MAHSASQEWRGLLREVTERISAMGGGALGAPAVMEPDASPASALELLTRELDLLEARYQQRTAQVALETKRQLANLDALHNANRLVTVGTLTMGMAHELGTPLGIVLARAQMIIADETDLAEARKDAEEIVRQVKRMTQMCREVLDYARPKTPAKLPLDVVVVARQMIALLQLDARKRRAKLLLADDPPATMVLGDASKLMQVITNLIINAAQAMPNGGTVTLSVETKRVLPPAVEGLAEAVWVCIHVNDIGTGIRSADLSHIFETFFTTKREGEGTGLGLAVSYRIVREHDGWIGVDTAEGKGSTFTIYLPPLGVNPTAPALTQPQPEQQT